MTAEVAVLNRQAVALAADSSVTVGGDKTFFSANKIFTLSKYYPVGIMVYGHAQLMGVPWETLIKVCRNEIGAKRFDTLESYATDFLDFIKNFKLLFASEQQEAFVQDILNGYYWNEIKHDIDRESASLIAKAGRISDSEMTDISSAVIQVHSDTWDGAEALASVPESHADDIVERYDGIIERAIKDAFEELKLSSKTLEQLRKIGGNLFSKAIFPAGASGVAIAGFGGSEAFPSIRRMKILGIANDRLIYAERGVSQISHDQSAFIVPFAQQDMVYLFMEGIDEGLKQFMETDLANAFSQYRKDVLKNIGKKNSEQRQAFSKALEEEADKLLRRYRKRVAAYRRMYLVDPIIEIAATLPKDELAAMAESLVSLTLFKRRVTSERETVGGPIDVALISKGDGFVWVKRKHYFPHELNPQFLLNYYKRGPYEEPQDKKQKSV